MVSPAVAWAEMHRYTPPVPTPTSNLSKTDTILGRGNKTTSPLSFSGSGKAGTDEWMIYLCMEPFVSDQSRTGARSSGTVLDWCE